MQKDLAPIVSGDKPYDKDISGNLTLVETQKNLHLPTDKKFLSNQVNFIELKKGEIL